MFYCLWTRFYGVFRCFREGRAIDIDRLRVMIDTYVCRHVCISKFKALSPGERHHKERPRVIVLF